MQEAAAFALRGVDFAFTAIYSSVLSDFVYRLGVLALPPPWRGRQRHSLCLASVPRCFRSEPQRRAQRHPVVSLAGVACLPRALESECTASGPSCQRVPVRTVRAPVVAERDAPRTA